jgi:hypothetical protein
MWGRSGGRWEIRFADGATDTYEGKGANSDGMPTFRNGAGSEVRIVVREDNSVIVMEQGCIRSGTLRDGQVKNGTSMPGCPHPGAWSATRQ